VPNGLNRLLGLENQSRGPGRPAADREIPYSREKAPAGCRASRRRHNAAAGAKVRIRDDSRYAKHRDVNRLLRSTGIPSSRELSAISATDRPDFEHLEAKGIDVLRRMAARQRKRIKGSS
jgi:hypothetical protein